MASRSTTTTRAARAYAIEFGTAMAAYGVVLVVSLALIEAHPHAGWRVPVALAPVVPLAAALAAFVRFLGRMDELQRRIQLLALGWSFPTVGLLTFAYGLLQNAGLPALSYLWVLPAMVVTWGIASGVSAWRFR